MRIAPPALALAALVSTAASAHTQAATDIYLLSVSERDGRVTAAGAPVAVTDRDGYDNQPAFTHDGTAILYTSIRDGQADTYRYDIATGATTRVTRTPESEYSPTPMPASDRFSVVRVEADSTQRLWSFGQDGTDPDLLLEDVAPVGYHAWVDEDRLGLFVLGDPPTLRVARISTGTARVRADSIGRSIQPMPGRSAVTFTRPEGEEWWIHGLDVQTGRSQRIAPTQGPDEYHAWTPGGVLLGAHGTGIYQWTGTGWALVIDLAEHALGTATRLAVSPDGRRLAVVIDREGPTTP